MEKTSPDHHAAVVLHDKLRRVASLPGVKEKAKKLIAAMKKHRYLQDKEVWGMTFSYGNFTGERLEALSPADIEIRIQELHEALDHFANVAPAVAPFVNEFRS